MPRPIRMAPGLSLHISESNLNNNKNLWIFMVEDAKTNLSKKQEARKTKEEKRNIKGA